MKKLDFTGIEKLCKNCGKKLILKINRDITRKSFCSRKCNCSYNTKQLRKNPEYVKMVVTACNTLEANKKKGRPREKHPKWKGGPQTHICNVCRISFKIPIHRSNKGYGKYCSRKCYTVGHRVDDIKTYCLNCNKEIWDKPKKKRQYCSCSCRAIHRLPKQKFSNTDIEIKIKEFLDKENISYKFQPLISDIVNADFLLYPNIVIFADGDYWHSLPHAINRDCIVNNKLTENHYKILRFKGSEIKYDFENVKTKIREIYHAFAE